METRTNIALIDLKRQYKSLKAEIDHAVAKVMDGAHFVRGPEHDAFAAEFSVYCGVSACAPLANGSDALYLVFRALDLKPGDEVITTPMTFIATVEMLVRAGVKPVFADVDAATYNIDPAKVTARVTAKTKALLPVHLYGQPAQMDAIMEIAGKHRLHVIEDACQAHGARFKTRRCGSFGVLACFSFYPSKNLGAFGDAGAVVSNDKVMVQRILRLGNHGYAQGYDYKEEGINSRLDEIQAAILRVKLKHLDVWNERRRRVAVSYDCGLEGVGDIVIPKNAPGCESVYHLYVIQTKSRDRLAAYLKDHGIACQVHYPQALHQLEVFRYMDLKAGSYPIAEEICSRALSLPMFPEITDSEIGQVVDRIRAFFRK